MKKNVYLEKINENLLIFLKNFDKFETNLNELCRLADGATSHINEIQRIFGADDDEEEEKNDEDESTINAGKLCELNENLNISTREIRQSWNSFEKQIVTIVKSTEQMPKLIRLFLDTTKSDVDLNDPSFRLEMTQLIDQFPLIHQFLFELSLEIQTLLFDLSNLKSLKTLAKNLEFLSVRSTSISISLEIIHVKNATTRTMTRNLLRIALTSAAIASTHFLFSSPNDWSKTKLFSTVKAAEYERRNASRARQTDRKKFFDDDDDDDDEDREGRDDEGKTDEQTTNARERRFHEFASVEYDGEIYMTPVDFLESVIAERPRPRIGRRQLTEEIVEAMLYKTPAKHRGSKRFFRQLEDSGLISFSEYLFLWVILTKPHTQFAIAFAMFDTDGNQLVDKREFLVLGKIMSDKRILRRQNASSSIFKQNSHPLHFEHQTPVNTTLLLHFFGKNGRDTLNYAEFHRFMENLQTEVLEIEFNEFSHGFKTISDLDFAEILLRYTDFDRETKKMILKKVKRTTNQPNGITFDQFKRFFAFLNNLEEFSIAMRFHQLSNKPISQAEFQRAVKISTGFELEGNIIGLIFRIFDVDDDQHLSYDEFMAVMKDRLSRGFQISETPEAATTKFEQFKRCFRDRAKYASVDLFD